MKKIDSAYDDLLKSNYDLFVVNFSDLQTEVRSWYKDVDMKAFDNRTKYDTGRDETTYSLLKISGIASNHFYAYKEQNGKMHLMDGFNRLLTDYGKLPVDPIVYIKVLTDDLSDNRLMNIMFRLNMWKIARDGSINSQFRTSNFLDRGFRLFIKTKFGITIQDRRGHDDMSVLDEYFRDESKQACYFSHRLPQLFKLFMNVRIVDDFKEIVNCNAYDEMEFKHFDTFFEGFIRFLSRRRLVDDANDHKFETYLTLLKNDKKFFNKLQGMSWTDSSRQNVYSFFDKIEEDLVTTK